MPSPPKPWEKAQQSVAMGPSLPDPVGASNADLDLAMGGGGGGLPGLSGTGSLSDPPSVPNRPSSLSSMTHPSRFGTNSYESRFGSGYGSGYGSSYGPGAFGSSYGSGYGGYSGYNRGYGGYGSSYGGSGGYNSPYASRFGSGYGGYGGYGGGYGSYGGGYGMNRPGMMGPNGPGGPMDPNNMPLTAQIEQSTASAFQTMDQIVQAFGGFAQMLESTFFATHSSFMAMVGVAEQLGHLKNYFGQFFSLVAVINFVRRMGYRVVGKLPPTDKEAITVKNFENFAKDGAAGAGADGKKAKSRRPLWVFIVFMVGIPWLMSKLIQRLQRQRLEAAAAAAAANPNNPNGTASADGTIPPAATGIIGPDGGPLQVSQIKDLEFCRALYDFNGETPAELSFRHGDIIAILSKVDPVTNQPSQWWRGRLRSGPIGHFPANYVEVIEKRQGPPVTGSETPKLQADSTTSNNNTSF